MKRPKVSVVIPTYNVERFFRQCIDSVLAQTLKDIEIIIVDDGTPDNCGKIADEYAVSDKRVLVIHQKNGGYGKAVNVGVDKARGKYIAILEPDDWVDPEIYERLFKNAELHKAEISRCGFYCYNSQAPIGRQDWVYPGHEKAPWGNFPAGAFTIEQCPKLLAYHASIWAAIYKRAFIKGIKMDETPGASYQDLPFMIKSYCLAKRIVITDLQLHHYREEPSQGNSSNAFGQKRIRQTQNAIASFEMAKRLDCWKKIKEPLVATHLVTVGRNAARKMNLVLQKQQYMMLKPAFTEIASDKHFYGSYFTIEDREFFDSVAYHSWNYILIKKIQKKVKNILFKFLITFSPTYRTTMHIKDHVAMLEMQNKELQKSLDEIRKSIKA